MMDAYLISYKVLAMEIFFLHVCINTSIRLVLWLN